MALGLMRPDFDEWRIGSILSSVREESGHADQIVPQFVMNALVNLKYLEKLGCSEPPECPWLYQVGIKLCFEIVDPSLLRIASTMVVRGRITFWPVCPSGRCASEG